MNQKRELTQVTGTTEEGVDSYHVMRVLHF